MRIYYRRSCARRGSDTSREDAVFYLIFTGLLIGALYFGATGPFSPPIANLMLGFLVLLIWAVAWSVVVARREKRKQAPPPALPAPRPSAPPRRLPPPPYRQLPKDRPYPFRPYSGDLFDD